MPKFAITAPDGHSYEVEGEGTEQEALAHFQSTWKPEAAAPVEAEYGNESRRTPAGKVDPMAALRISTLSGVENWTPSDLSTGLKKSVANNVKGSGLDTPVAPENPLVAKQNPGYLDTIDEEYKAAGPEAGVGKFLGDAATVALPGAKAGSVARAALAPKSLVEGAKMLPKAVGRAVEGAASGAVSGGLLAPGEGETRLGNAAQGAAIGGVASPLIGAGGDLSNKVMQTVRASPLARARKILEKADVDIDDVTTKVQNPAHIPTSIAGQAESPELAAIEKTVRRVPGKGAANWERLDDSTNEEAWKKTQETLQNSIADLHPRADAHALAMKPTQNALDQIPFRTQSATSLEKKLEALRTNSLFPNDAQGQQGLNQVIAEVSAPNTTLGSLANLDTNLSQASKKYSNLDDRQRGLVRAVIREKIDSLSGGSLTKAHADYASTRAPLEQSQVAHAIHGRFQDPEGVIVGATRGDIPKMTQNRVNSAMLRGIDHTDKNNPVNMMSPLDRGGLEQIAEALRKSNYAKTSAVPPANIPGGSVSEVYGNPTGVPAPVWYAGKSIANKVLSGRNAATREALSESIMSKPGWDKMLDASLEAGKISAKDAEMLARILRGIGPIAGAGSIGED